MMKIAKTESSAKVVDGKLILSLITAKTPVVWQMDLDQAKASALEVKEGEGENPSFTLALKTPRGSVDTIAEFETKEAAVEGLMAASKALENAQGHIRAVNENDASAVAYVPPATKKSGWKKWIVGILVLIFAWLLYSLLLAQIQPQVMNGPSIQTSTSGPAASAPSARESQGVPVSADDFLSAP